MMPIGQDSEIAIPNRSPLYFVDDTGVNRFNFVGVTFVEVWVEAILALVGQVHTPGDRVKGVVKKIARERGHFRPTLGLVQKLRA